MSERSGIMIRVVHVREEMLCTRGMREWLMRHGFDLSDFIREGIAVEDAEATGDAFALRVAARARAEAAQEGQA